jgi:hypothetical protein
VADDNGQALQRRPPRPTLIDLTREQAQALAIDLSRRSTPAEGGFCTFQPVIDGGACPWNLDCGNCDKFVLSGADLLYWRRKREQWRLLAEGAPDDATADYLHAYFEPTARAIDGPEKALARTLEEKLQAARSSNRFADRRIAQLEAELASQPSTVSHPTC